MYSPVLLRDMHNNLDFIEKNVDEAYLYSAPRNQTARLIERESDCDSGTMREVKRTQPSPARSRPMNISTRSEVQSPLRRTIKQEGYHNMRRNTTPIRLFSDRMTEQTAQQVPAQFWYIKRGSGKRNYAHYQRYCRYLANLQDNEIEEISNVDDRRICCVCDTNRIDMETTPGRYHRKQDPKGGRQL